MNTIQTYFNNQSNSKYLSLEIINDMINARKSLYEKSPNDYPDNYLSYQIDYLSNKVNKHLYFFLFEYGKGCEILSVFSDELDEFSEKYEFTKMYNSIPGFKYKQDIFNG